MRRNLIVGSILFIIVFLIGSAVVYFYSDYPADLRVQNVRVVDRAGLREVAGEAADYPFITRSRENYYLHVTLQSEVDLFSAPDSSGLTVGVDSLFCDQPKKVVDLALPDIFVNGISEIMYNIEPDPSPQEKSHLKNGWYNFDAILVIERSDKFELSKALKIDKEQKYYLNFNLRNQPRDVCLQVSGGNMLGYSYNSNTVTISKERIAEAFSKFN